MKSNKQIACLAVLALIMPACRHEPNMNGAASSAKLSLTIERNPAPKSSLGADENALKESCGKVTISTICPSMAAEA